MATPDNTPASPHPAKGNVEAAAAKRTHETNVRKGTIKMKRNLKDAGYV